MIWCVHIHWVKGSTWDSHQGWIIWTQYCIWTFLIMFALPDADTILKHLYFTLNAIWVRPALVHQAAHNQKQSPLSFVSLYLDRAVCNTAGSPLCSSQPRPQQDRLHFLPPHTHTPCAVTQNPHHSFWSMVTMVTRGKGHLHTRESIWSEQMWTVFTNFIILVCWHSSSWLYTQFIQCVSKYHNWKWLSLF